MRSRHLLATVAGGTVLAVTAALASVGGPASADTPLGPRTQFTMVVNTADGTVAAPSDGEAIPNIDSVKSTIRAYYNASGGKANRTSSPYIEQVKRIERQLLASLPTVAAGSQAITFDVDDTLLSNYDFEDFATNFNFDNTVNAQYVAAHAFPAIAGMPATLRTLANRGYTLYGITGRPAAQEPDTLANLNEQGFTSDGTASGTPLFTAASLYTKGATVVTNGNAAIPDQPWVNCNADGTPGSCSTVEYKALTRQQIQNSTGTTIAMNVGDQISDLQGGFSAASTKIPNPTYFLASPDLTTAPASDALLAPPSSYTMQPDGSSGYTVASGDDIPNIDPLRKMIRGYYNAPTGVADKTTSPYISQLASLESTWTPQVSTDCATGAAKVTAATAQKATAAKKVKKAKKAVKKRAKQVVQAARRVEQAHGAKAERVARRQLAKAAKAERTSIKRFKAKRAAAKAITIPVSPAVVFDADDTTLWNYDLEDSVLKFVYSPSVAATYIAQHKFPAVPGMVAVVRAAANAGCTIFGLTGRPASQQADTVANLAEAGFTGAGGTALFTTARFFTKDTANQPWVDCGSDRVCSTIEYKSGTRAHIEGLGFDVVGNFGDQFSDLIGGYADHVYKLPNPTYYLP